jgi:hypothetical protein
MTATYMAAGTAGGSPPAPSGSANTTGRSASPTAHDRPIAAPTPNTDRGMSHSWFGSYQSPIAPDANTVANAIAAVARMTVVVDKTARSSTRLLSGDSEPRLRPAIRHRRTPEPRAAGAPYPARWDPSFPSRMTGTSRS